MTSLGERQLEDLYNKLAMDEDDEVRDSDRSDTEGSINSDAESDLDSDRVSPSEESGDSSEELTGASLAPFRAYSDSDSASASPDDDDDARDERLSDFGKRNRLAPRSPRDVTT